MGKGMRAGKKPKAPGGGSMQKQLQQKIRRLRPQRQLQQIIRRQRLRRQKRQLIPV